MQKYDGSIQNYEMGPVEKYDSVPTPDLGPTPADIAPEPTPETTPVNDDRSASRPWGVIEI